MIETITANIFYLELKENIENDMAAQGFFFSVQPTAEHYGSFASQSVCWHLPCCLEWTINSSYPILKMNSTVNLMSDRCDPKP